MTARTAIASSRPASLTASSATGSSPSSTTSALAPEWPRMYATSAAPSM
jgi:hypothetical protein